MGKGGGQLLSAGFRGANNNPLQLLHLQTAVTPPKPLLAEVVRILELLREFHLLRAPRLRRHSDDDSPSPQIFLGDLCWGPKPSLRMGGSKGSPTEDISNRDSRLHNMFDGAS